MFYILDNWFFAVNYRRSYEILLCRLVDDPSYYIWSVIFSVKNCWKKYGYLCVFIIKNYNVRKIKDKFLFEIYCLCPCDLVDTYFINIYRYENISKQDFFRFSALWRQKSKTIPYRTYSENIIEQEQKPFFRALVKTKSC